MLATFSQLGLVKMKSPAETRSKVIDIDKLAKLTQDITGEPIGEGHWKSVLVGMLDPLTRQHTPSLMGSKHSVAELKQAILEFTSSVVLDSADAMQLGRFGGQEGLGGEPAGGGW